MTWGTAYGLEAYARDPITTRKALLEDVRHRHCKGPMNESEGPHKHDLEQEDLAQ